MQSKFLRPATLLLLVAISTFFMHGCGGGSGGGTDGGGGGGNGTPGSGGSSGGSAGTWLFTVGGTAYRRDLQTGAESGATDLPLDSVKTALGYSGGNLITDDQKNWVSNKSTWSHKVNVREVSPSGFKWVRSLPVFYAELYGPVQPSPNGQLFAMHTRENEMDYITVVDATLKVIYQTTGYGDPVWLGNDRLVVVSVDSLYVLSINGTTGAVRIGPAGLGKTGTEPGYPAFPAVSPDGSTIAFVQDWSVWRIRMDGTGLMRLTTQLPSTAWPTWSPDGTKLEVQAGACPVGGIGTMDPGRIIISPDAQNQDLLAMRAVIHTCGALYWVP